MTQCKYIQYSKKNLNALTVSSSSNPDKIFCRIRTEYKSDYVLFSPAFSIYVMYIFVQQIVDDRKVTKFIREIIITKWLGTRLLKSSVVDPHWYQCESMGIGDPDPGQNLKSQKV